MNKNTEWHLISGEYPPGKGGIGFHCKSIAEELSKQKIPTTVWCCQEQELDTHKRELKINTLSPRWSKEDFDQISHKLDSSSHKKKILVQFAPDLYGDQWNFNLTHWLKQRKSLGDVIFIMIHEVPMLNSSIFNFKSWSSYRKQKKMCSQAMATSDRVMLTTENWLSSVRKNSGLNRKKVEIIPVPSSIPLIVNDSRVNNIRKAFAEEAPLVIGSFGSFSEPQILDIYSKTMVPILQKHRDAVWLCLGRNSVEFSDMLKKMHPEIAYNIRIAGELDAEALSAHIQSCDILLQPYPNGVSTRRSSIMAGLLHARPIVTSSGDLTESIWQQNSGVSLSPWKDTSLLIKAMENLIKDPKKRISAGKKAAVFYQNNFSISKVIQRLID